MTNERSRGPVLTTLAILMGLLALSNFSKPLGQAMQPESDAGFVFFGHRLHGAANAVAGPLFGVLLAAYAYGAWTRRSWVVPLAALLFAVSLPPLLQDLRLSSRLRAMIGRVARALPPRADHR